MIKVLSGLRRKQRKDTVHITIFNHGQCSLLLPFISKHRPKGIGQKGAPMGCGPWKKTVDRKGPQWILFAAYGNFMLFWSPPGFPWEGIRWNNVKGEHQLLEIFRAFLWILCKRQSKRKEKKEKEKLLLMFGAMWNGGVGTRIPPSMKTASWHSHSPYLHPFVWV